jgi:ribosomal protein L11 methyltransferase
VHDRGEPDWYVVEVDVAHEDLVDVTSGALWSAGAAGIEERPSSNPDERAAIELHVFVSRDALAPLLSVAGPSARVRAAAQAGFVDNWSRWAPPVQVGRVRVEPVGDAGPVEESSSPAVRIRAGRAFGWGGHPTTVLALELLQERCQPGMTVLDMGTGSGVLAIAAARLGASSVVALEIDPEARREAAANVLRNAVDEIVTVTDFTLDRVTSSFDVVVANLDRAALVQLAPELVARVAIGGSIVVSGLLSVHEADVIAAVPTVRWSDRRRSGEWTALAGSLS